jgi:hypothetical protein
MDAIYSVIQTVDMYSKESTDPDYASDETFVVVCEAVK